MTVQQNANAMFWLLVNGRVQLIRDVLLQRADLSPKDCPLQR